MCAPFSVHDDTPDDTEAMAAFDALVAAERRRLRLALQVAGGATRYGFPRHNADAAISETVGAVTAARHTLDRLYLRRAGEKKVRLHGTPWAPDFMRAYADALAGIEPVEPRSINEAAPGTWRSLCIAYFASSEFAAYDVMTRKRRRSSLEATFAEKPDPKGKATYADFPVHRMTSAAIRLLRDRKADTPEGANRSARRWR